MRDSVLKFLSSVVLFICVVSLIFSFAISGFPEIFRFVLWVCTIGMCGIKFLVVMALEPDSLWEIIKKFVYIFVSILMLFSLGNTILLWCCGIILLADTVWECRRFVWHLRNS